MQIVACCSNPISGKMDTKSQYCLICIIYESSGWHPEWCVFWDFLWKLSIIIKMWPFWMIISLVSLGLLGSDWTCKIINKRGTGLTRLETLPPLVPTQEWETLDQDLVVLCFAYNCAGHEHHLHDRLTVVWELSIQR